MHIRPLLTTLFMSLLATSASAVHTVAELKLSGSSNTAMLQLYPHVLQGEQYRDVPCHVITICGKQGVMKSTILRALGVLFEMMEAVFKTKDQSVATTTSVDISDVSAHNHLLLDMIGSDDPSFAMQYGLDPVAVDKAFSQLTAPVSNVLIYPFHRKMFQSDLDSIAMYADHSKFHVGEMHKQGGRKPTLILAARADVLHCMVRGVAEECEPAEYLQQTLPADHPARTSFGRIELVHIPELMGDDLSKIQPDNFHPKEVYHYWASIQRIGQIINDSKSDDLSAYWAGGELGYLFELIAPMINGEIDADFPSVRTSLLTTIAHKEALKVAEVMSVKMQSHVEEPFLLANEYRELLLELRQVAEARVLQKYEVYRGEAKLYGAILRTVLVVLDEEVKEINAEVKVHQDYIMSHEKSAYENACDQLREAEQYLSFILSGDASEVDHTLVNNLKGIIDQYHAALLDWTLPEDIYADHLSYLKSKALSVWNAAHEINDGKHCKRQLTFREEVLPPVEFFYQKEHNTPSFEHTHVHEAMANSYPQFFSDAALRNTISIDVVFHSTTGGSGRLVLHGEDREYTVCHKKDSGKKGFGSALSYNPKAKVLHAWTYGWGFKGGKHTNRNWMKGVTFTIVTNALSTQPPHYAVPYVKGDYATSSYLYSER